MTDQLVLDTSALTTVVFGEPDAERFLDLLNDRVGDILIGTATFVESAIVTEARRGPDGVRELRALLGERAAEQVPVDSDAAELAVSAWRRYSAPSRYLPFPSHCEGDEEHRAGAHRTGEGRREGRAVTHPTPTLSATRTPAWRYGIGMFGTSIPINMIKGSMLLYYVDILGLDVRAYGAVMVIYAVIDAIDNPVLGYLSDRTRTRFGRRRPWLLVGAPLLAASVIAFFSAPESLDGVGLVLWFAVFAILCEAFDSMLNANYGALLPELYPVERDRAVANALRQGFQLVALVISLAITPLLTTSVFGSERSTEGFQTTAIVYGAIAVAAISFMAVSARENPRHSLVQRPELLPSVWSIVRSPLFWKVGLTGACYGIAMALVLSGIQLYVRYSLGLPVANALYLQGVVILVTAAALAVWTRVVARRGALWTWRLAFAVLAASFAVLFFAVDLITAIAAGVLVGVGWAGMLATNDLIVARVLDADAAGNGEHREGLFLSAFGFFGRLNGIVTGLALTSLGVFFGYNSGGDPGGDPGLAFRFYLCVYPFLLATVGAIAARLLVVPAPAEPVAAAGLDGADAVRDDTEDGAVR